MNPHAHLVAQVRALLRTEERMGPDARALFSWVLRADYAGTHTTVIKAGANTVVIQHGEARGEPCYPDEALRALGLLARQDYPLYVARRDGQSRTSPSLPALLAVVPREGDMIYGMRPDGVPVATHAARRDVTGRVRWLPRNSARREKQGE